ncbi:uncharacterized protein LOC121406532 [Lytechinus variegatus]|uniref:uncharacterized protein LOC121406532 n=1 Tax=Lytechinus variegatus TaxID=7654 RepID=UPI001BB1CA4F|nr:uncharacterized protein LOC121406532 [Lytechinus variegatus]
MAEKSVIMGSSETNASPVPRKVLRSGRNNRCFDQHVPTITITPAVFVHSGRDVPSCISDCKWLQDCYYTSLGISQTITQESDSEISPVDPQEDGNLLKAQNGGFKIINPSRREGNKLDLMRTKSTPTSIFNSSSPPSRDRQQIQGWSKGPGRQGFLCSESDSCLYSTSLQKRSKCGTLERVAAADQPLVFHSHVPAGSKEQRYLSNKLCDESYNAMNAVDSKTSPTMKSNVKLAWTSPN